MGFATDLECSFHPCLSKEILSPFCLLEHQFSTFFNSQRTDLCAPLVMSPPVSKKLFQTCFSGICSNKLFLVLPPALQLLLICYYRAKERGRVFQQFSLLYSKRLQHIWRPFTAHQCVPHTKHQLKITALNLHKVLICKVAQNLHKVL